MTKTEKILDDKKRRMKANTITVKKLKDRLKFKLK